MGLSVADLITARGTGGNYCEDLAALRFGDVRSDGEFFEGSAITAGFRHIREPGEALCIMLVLSNGQVARGDCTSVVYAGYGGRDPVFRASAGETVLLESIRPWLVGRELTAFRPLAAELEARFGELGDTRLHVALRFGLSQAILHAVALRSRRTMAEVVAEEYGAPSSWRPVPVLAQSGRSRYDAVDRMIMRAVPVIPHGDFTSVDEIGPDAINLFEYVRWIRSRIERRGHEGYLPSFYLDLYGTLGEACGDDPERVAELIGRLETEAAPHPITIESPMLADDRETAIAQLSTLVAALGAQGSSARIAADEFCNTLSDIAEFAEHKAAHVIQIKMPDLGAVSQSIEAVRLCHQWGMLAFLGGSCNETDWSSRVTVQIALAAEADLIYNKPGFGVDEGLMIVGNEMARTLALIRANPSDAA